VGPNTLSQYFVSKPGRSTGPLKAKVAIGAYQHQRRHAFEAEGSVGVSVTVGQAGHGAGSGFGRE
jgi:hypothetical protein